MNLYINIKKIYNQKTYSVIKTIFFVIKIPY